MGPCLVATLCLLLLTEAYKLHDAWQQFADTVLSHVQIKEILAEALERGPVQLGSSHMPAEGEGAEGASPEALSDAALLASSVLAALPQSEVSSCGLRAQTGCIRQLGSSSNAAAARKAREVVAAAEGASPGALSRQFVSLECPA